MKGMSATIEADDLPLLLTRAAMSSCSIIVGILSLKSMLQMANSFTFGATKLTQATDWIGGILCLRKSLPCHFDGLGCQIITASRPFVIARCSWKANPHINLPATLTQQPSTP